MRLIQSDAIELTPWADDEHDPLTSTARGPLPAFDQLVNGQTIQAPRANRIPRRPAPRDTLIVSLCRRLHRSAKARYLAWQLKHMRARMDVLEADMDEALQQAIAMAKRHQHSPALQAHRRAMRDEHTPLAAEWLRVRAELDALEMPL